MYFFIAQNNDYSLQWKYVMLTWWRFNALLIRIGEDLPKNISELANGTPMSAMSLR